MKNRTHEFAYYGDKRGAETTCGLNRDGTIFETGKNITCKKCIKISKNKKRMKKKQNKSKPITVTVDNSKNAKKSKSSVNLLNKDVVSKFV